MTTWQLPLTITAPPLNLNKRMHWAAADKHRKALRHEAMVRARAHRIPACQLISVRLVYRPRDKRTRDPSNFIPTQKPLLDGIVDAGVVPDDNPRYVRELMPRILPPTKGQPAACWLEIRRLA